MANPGKVSLIDKGWAAEFETDLNATETEVSAQAATKASQKSATDDDRPERLDYARMARVVDAVAGGVLALDAQP